MFRSSAPSARCGPAREQKKLGELSEKLDAYKRRRARGRAARDEPLTDSLAGPGARLGPGSRALSPAQPGPTTACDHGRPRRSRRSWQPHQPGAVAPATGGLGAPVVTALQRRGPASAARSAADWATRWPGTIAATTPRVAPPTVSSRARQVATIRSPAPRSPAHGLPPPWPAPTAATASASTGPAAPVEQPRRARRPGGSPSRPPRAPPGRPEPGSPPRRPGAPWPTASAGPASPSGRAIRAVSRAPSTTRIWAAPTAEQPHQPDGEREQQREARAPARP